MMLRNNVYMRLFVVLAFSNLSALSALNKANNTRIRSVAVMQFTNNTGSKSMGFAGASLAEAMSSSLSRQKSIKTVEREQLGNVFKEIELQQSGAVNEKDLIKAGQLSKAEVLVLGSYTGSSSSLQLTIKAVDVETGSILASTELNGTIEEVFSQLESSASVMALQISGSEFGYLTVEANVSKAEVFIDSNPAGKTPLTGYRLVTGMHTIRIVKDGYLSYETDEMISNNKTVNVNGVLQPNTMVNRFGISINAHYMMPVQSFIQRGYFFMMAVEYTYDTLSFGLEAGTNTKMYHNYTIVGPYSKTFEEVRDYSITTTMLFVRYTPFRSFRVMTPYAAFSVGILFVKDNAVRPEYFGKVPYDKLLIGFQPAVGFTFLPRSPFNLFIEGRFLLSAARVNRPTIASITLSGQEVKKEDNFLLMIPSIGIGARLYF